MYFQDVCMVKSGGFENKQRIRLSEQSYSVLAEDTAVFQPESDTVNAGRITSTMINRIFRNFRDAAHSSIAFTLEKQREELEMALASLQPKAVAAQAIELLSAKAQALLEAETRQRAAGKSQSFSIRIDADNITYLAEEGQREAPFYHDKVGLYIKAVIEEYCALPYVERERVYFKKEVLDVIQVALAKTNPAKLKLTLRSKRRTESGEQHNILYVKPVRIQRDTANQYNYLVGLISPTGEAPWRPGSVRLTSIQACTPRAESHISKEGRDEIERAIRERGVQYLSASDEELASITVQFTSVGEQMYSKLLHQRPMYIEKESDTRIYHFFCTLRQAENYFFKFGPEVKILVPQSLTNVFRNRYATAALQYEGNQ